MLFSKIDEGGSMSLLPEAYSSYAGDIDGLIALITYFVVGWFLIALVALLYNLFTGLKKEGGKAEYIPGIGWDQTKWILIPVMLVTLSDFVIDIATVRVWEIVEYGTPENEEKIRVKATGTMWNWVFTYPGPDKELNTSDDVVIEEMDSTMVIPVNVITEIDLAARDVLHSFFVREFRFKQDVLPGRTLTRWFKPTEKGTFELICAEICGARHAYMRNYVKVVSREEYDQFIADLNAEAAAMVVKEVRGIE